MPELGRFVSPDILIPDPADPQSYNRYAYVLNNPLVYIDPSGHRVDSPDFIPDQEIVTNVMTPFWWPPFNPLAPAFETLNNSAIGAELVNLVRSKDLVVTFGRTGNFAFSENWINLIPVVREPNMMAAEWAASLIAHELVHVLQREAAEANDAYYAWGRGTLQMEVEANIVQYAMRYELSGEEEYLKRLTLFTYGQVDWSYKKLRSTWPERYGNPIFYDRGADSPNPWAANLLALGFSPSAVAKIMTYAAMSPLGQAIQRGVE